MPLRPGEMTYCISRKFLNRIQRLKENPSCVEELDQNLLPPVGMIAGAYGALGVNEPGVLGVLIRQQRTLRGSTFDVQRALQRGPRTPDTELPGSQARPLRVCKLFICREKKSRCSNCVSCAIHQPPSLTNYRSKGSMLGIQRRAAPPSKNNLTPMETPMWIRSFCISRIAPRP